METFYNTWQGCSDFDTHRIANPTYIASRNYYAQYDLLRGNPQILGTLFCNWNDRSWANDFDVLDLVLSYIGVISEKSWYGDDDRFDNGSDFVKAFELKSICQCLLNPLISRIPNLIYNIFRIYFLSSIIN